MTRVIEAVEAFDDPLLEAVVVGDSICLHQPMTRALALLPGAGDGGAAANLPSRKELLADGFLVDHRTHTSSGLGDACRKVAPAALAERIGTYRLGEGAAIALYCDCAWLGPRLGAALAPLEIASTGEAGGRHVDLVLQADDDETLTFILDGSVIQTGVARSRSRRLALNIILVEGLRHVGVDAILHSAGVAREGRCALIVGPTGAGKSTLALGLAARGWRHLADDLVALGGGGPMVHPFPVAASVKSDSWPVVGEDFPALMNSARLLFGTREVRYLDVHGGAALPEGAVRPALIVVAQRQAGLGRPEVERLSPEAAFAALIESGSEAVGDPPSMRALAELVNNTRAVRFAFDDIDRAGEALGTLMAGGAGHA